MLSRSESLDRKPTNQMHPEERNFERGDRKVFRYKSLIFNPTVMIE
jgi:hypothetical protein